MSKMCNKLLCDLGQWAKWDALYKPSKIALITGCGLLSTTTTWQSLSATSFLIPFLIHRMVEIQQSNLSAICWAVWPASVKSNIIMNINNKSSVIQIMAWHRACDMQVTTWTNGGQGIWRHMRSLGYNEMKSCHPEEKRHWIPKHHLKTWILI